MKILQVLRAVALFASWFAVGHGAEVGTATAAAEPGGSVAPERAALHYRPTDTVLGDVHPFHENGTWHLFYLKPGFHSAVAQSTDLLHWSPGTLQFAAATGDDTFRPYFVLGVFRDARCDVYRSFYGCRSWMVGSVSADLRTWSPAPREVRVPPRPDLYASQRDPYVFHNANDGRYWCVATCRVKNASPGRDGAVGYTTSPDLVHWERWEHLLYPGNIGEPECPQLFELGGSWYLLASVHDRAVGRPSYWVAKAPTGPWSVAGSGYLDGKDLCAAQVASDGRRLLLFGWIPLRASSPGTQHWGGHLALPREVVQLGSGELTTRLPAELAQAVRGAPVESISTRSAAATAGTWTPGASELRFEGGAAPGRALWPGRHDCGDLELDIVLSHETRRAGVFLERSADGPAIEVALERQPDRLVIQTRSGAIHAEIPVASPPSGPMRLHVLFEQDIVEAFLDDRYSLVARTPHNLSPSGVGVFAEGAPTTFHNVRLFHLRGQATWDGLPSPSPTP